MRWVTAMALGVAVALLSRHWSYAWLPPDLWEDVAVAAGMRPPEAPFPLLWHFLVQPLFNFLDMARAIRVLQMVGHCAHGIVAMMVFAILHETMPKTLPSRVVQRSWCRWIVRAVLAQGAILFACSDPVWEVGQVFGPAMFHLILLLLIKIFL